VLRVREDHAQLLPPLADRLGGQVHAGHEHARRVRVDAALDHDRMPGQQPDPGQVVYLRAGREGQPLGLGRLGRTAPQGDHQAAGNLSQGPRPAGEGQQLAEALHPRAADDHPAGAAPGRDDPVARSAANA
jgi:hypothetical protein